MDNPRLREMLLERRERDQEVRLAGRAQWTEETGRRLAAVDRENTTWLKNLVFERGWPHIGVVGEDGASAAWLLLQHADMDIDFQEYCLPLLQLLATEGLVARPEVGYLTDRVRVNRGKPQLYGTQYMNGPDGDLVPRPIEDPAGLDARRKEMGMEPHAEYDARMRDLG